MIDLSLHKKLQSNTGDMAFHVALNLKEGVFLAIQGKSGAGKTSLLRMIAGLMNPDKGHITVHNQDWFNSESKTNISVQQRQIGYVFQDYALFPNMTVKENLSYALRKTDDEKMIPELIEVMELGTLQNRYSETLSGGQKQRIALARALVQKPALLLLDEPLAALDLEIRQKLQKYLLQVHRQYQLTTLMVSHDISETLKMADEVMVMEHGQVINYGKSSKVLAHNTVSGKFQFTGQVIDINREDVIYIISVLVGKELVKVVSDEHEAKKLGPGDTVLVASKAFNPIIKKLG